MSDKNFLKCASIFCTTVGVAVATSGGSEVRAGVMFVFGIVAIVGAMVIESVEDTMKDKGAS